MQVDAAKGEVPLQGIRAYMATVWEVSSKQVYATYPAPDAGASSANTDGSAEDDSGTPRWLQDLLIQDAKSITQAHQVAGGASVRNAAHAYGCVLTQMRVRSHGLAHSVHSATHGCSGLMASATTSSRHVTPTPSVTGLVVAYPMATHLPRRTCLR